MRRLVVDDTYMSRDIRLYETECPTLRAERQFKILEIYESDDSDSGDIELP